MNRRRIVFLGIVVGTLLVWLTMVHRWHATRTSCDSSLLWNNEEALLIIRCSEVHNAWTVLEMLRALIQWNLSASAENPTHHRVQEYNIIYHVRDGTIMRHRCDVPGDVLYLKPFEGGLYGFTQSNAWQYVEGEFAPIPDEEADRIRRATGTYNEAAAQEGWSIDMSFSPSATRDQKLVRRLDVSGHAVTIAIRKILSQDAPGKILEVQFRVSVDGGEEDVVVEDVIDYQPR